MGKIETGKTGIENTDKKGPLRDEDRNKELEK